MDKLSSRTKVRGAGVVLLVAGLWLTHTLRLLGHIGTLIGHWAAGFVFSPVVWLGVILGVAGIGLFLIGGRLAKPDKPVAAAPTPELPKKRPATKAPASDADPDIDAILKKYNIS